MLICLVSGLAVCTTARAVPVNSAETSDNPYQSIVDRNVFSLKPPPPPADPTEVNKPVVVKITLTGITTILGNKRVLMKTPPPPAKPGQGPQTEQSYILTEGQREGDIEVLEIDEKAGSVKVNNAGTIQTLTFDKDGAKLPATAAPPGSAAMPGGQPIPGLPMPNPSVHLPTPGGATTPNFQLPTRVPRLPATGSQAGTIPPAGGMNFSPSGSTPSYVSPGLIAGATPVQALQNSSVPGSMTTTPMPSQQISAEEQAILIEAERQAGGPNAALLPPTPLSNMLNRQNSQGPQQQQTPTITLPPLPGHPY